MLDATDFWEVTLNVVLFCCLFEVLLPRYLGLVAEFGGFLF